MVLPGIRQVRRAAWRLRFAGIARRRLAQNLRMKALIFYRKTGFLCYRYNCLQTEFQKQFVSIPRLR
jgi:hypothetical protein